MPTMTTNISIEEMEIERAKKGQVLAALGHVRKIEPRTTSAQLYKVRSESNRDTLYSVIQKSSGETICDCQDFIRRGLYCKHIFAVAFSLRPKLPEEEFNP